MEKFDILKKGDKGARVKCLQTLLNRIMGYHLVVDGDFGDKTVNAVKAFQREHVDETGVFLVRDGSVGAKTAWAIMHEVGLENCRELFETDGKASGTVVRETEADASGTGVGKTEVDTSGTGARIVLKKAIKKVRGIVLHCTAEREDRCAESDAKSIDRIHKAQGWSEIGYHYVVKQDGTIETGRDVNKKGAHANAKNILSKDKYDLNTYTLGIVYTGGYDKNGRAKDTRTPAQKKSMVWLVKELCKMYGLSKNEVYCHNQFANKACPCFSIEDFRKELMESERHDMPSNSTMNTLVMVLVMALGLVFESCSQKVTDTHIEEKQDVEQTFIRDVDVSDNNAWAIDFNSSTHIMSGIDEWWKAHIKRTLYTTDSLGNQNVTMTEEIDLDGGKHADTETNTESDVQGQGESSHREVIHDTIYIAEKSESVTDIEEVRSSGVPLWWKIAVCVVIGALLWRTTRR